MKLQLLTYATKRYGQYLKDVDLTTGITLHGDVNIPIEEFNAQITDERYAKLETVYNKLINGVKRQAIDKDYMKQSETIDNQRMVYETLYTGAKLGLFDAAENEAYIYANETSSADLFFVIKTLNDIRSIVDKMILNFHPNIDEVLIYADNLSLVRSELTGLKLQEITEYFTDKSAV